MDSQTYHEALAALAWQVELGADEAMLDAPVDRYGLDAAPATAPHAPAAPDGTDAAVAPVADPVEDARAAAGGAADLDGLKAALSALRSETGRP